MTSSISVVNYSENGVHSDLFWFTKSREECNRAYNGVCKHLYIATRDYSKLYICTSLVFSRLIK